LATSQVIGEKHSTSKSTVERAATFSEAIDTLAEAIGTLTENLGSEMRNKLLDGVGEADAIIDHRLAYTAQSFPGCRWRCASRLFFHIGSYQSRQAITLLFLLSVHFFQIGFVFGVAHRDAMHYESRTPKLCRVFSHLFCHYLSSASA
jgi:hypothetical protein